jgi:hypothetical protein
MFTALAVICSLALQEPPSSARAFWEPWAASRKYRMVSSKDERVLMLLPEERGRAERALELVEKSLARTDEMLPKPPPPKDAPPPAPPKPADATKGPPPGSKSSPEWGDADRALDTGTIVFGLFRKPADYADALTRIGEAHPYLEPWLATGKRDPGCILERPLFAACVDNVPGMQEWNPENEIVHRVAYAAMIRRFGRQPVWVGLGVGWNVEFDLLSSIYCFPWRTGFVSVHEHGGWDPQLKRMFANREKRPLDIDDIASIKRGGFSIDDAAISWGTVRFLYREHPKELPALLAELQALHDRLGRTPTPDGKGWTMAAEFEVPAGEQKGAIERIVGSDAFAQAADSFRGAKRGKKAGS